MAHDGLLQRDLDRGNLALGHLAEELQGDVQAGGVHPADGAVALLAEAVDEAADGVAHILGELAGDEEAVGLLGWLGHLSTAARGRCPRRRPLR